MSAGGTINIVDDELKPVVWDWPLFMRWLETWSAVEHDEHKARRLPA